MWNRMVGWQTIDLGLDGPSKETLDIHLLLLIGVVFAYRLSLILMAAVDVAFSLAVASDTGRKPSAAGIACIVDTRSVAAVRESCNVVGGWGFEACWPVERVFADEC